MVSGLQASGAIEPEVARRGLMTRITTGPVNWVSELQLYHVRLTLLLIHRRRMKGRAAVRKTMIGLCLVVFCGGGQVAQSQIQLINPDFETDVTGWTAETDVTLQWSVIDVDNDPGSGSAEVTNSRPGPLDGAGMLQCVSGAVEPGASYDFGGAVFIPDGQSRTGEAQVGLRWYDGAGCTGSTVGDQPRRSTEVLNAWVRLVATDQIAPPGAASVLFLAFPSKVEVGGSLVAYFDDLHVGKTPVFADDFESGGTEAWSATVMPFVTVTPYYDWADIEIVGRVYCVSGNCPWGSGYHDGIDYVTANNLVPFRAACDGVVTMVDSFITGAGNRQVNVLMELENGKGFGLVYAFEPMTPDAANQQDANIFVQVGSQLAAGDLIGNLVRAPAVGSHVHWGVVANYTQVCPLPFLSDTVHTDLLDLIRRDTPGGEICY